MLLLLFFGFLIIFLFVLNSKTFFEKYNPLNNLQPYDSDFLQSYNYDYPDSTLLTKNGIFNVNTKYINKDLNDVPFYKRNFILNCDNVLLLAHLRNLK